MRLAAVPGVRVLRTYERAWLSKDVVAGLVLTALLVPQGMAYAELAGLPPITGLYTSILCLIGYAMFGPSKILVLGPDSSLGPMIAATILPLIGADGDPAKAIALASMLALLVGAIMLLAGAAQARLHRRPAVEADADRLHERTRADDPGRPAPEAVRLLGRRRRLHPRARGRSSRASSTARPWRPRWRSGSAALVVILVLQRAMPKVPAVLVAVVLSILAVEVFDLAASGVSRGRDAAEGFPPFTVPDVGLGRPPAPDRRGARHRVRRAGRHDLDGVGVRGARRAIASTGTRR